MVWQWSPYAIPFIVVTAVLITSALLALWRRRHVVGTVTAVVLMLATAEWMITQALEMLSAQLSTAVFWDTMQFVGICIVPTGWLVYTLQYTGHEDWLTGESAR